MADNCRLIPYYEFEKYARGCHCSINSYNLASHYSSMHAAQLRVAIKYKLQLARESTIFDAATWVHYGWLKGPLIN
jgi:hypothetical protein